MYLAATTPGLGKSKNFHTALFFSNITSSLANMCRSILSKAGLRSATVLASVDAHIFFSGIGGMFGSITTSSACKLAKSSKRRST